MSSYAEVCEEAVRAGGEMLRRWVGRFEVREKAPADLVTEADIASQEAIKDVIGRYFPDDPLVAEEGLTLLRPDAPVCWVADPLDGTANYAHGFPHYCVSVGVVCQGRIEAGAIYDPVRDECYTAARGQGAFMNGSRLATSRTTDIGNALVAISFPPRVRRDSRHFREFLAVVEVCQAVRRTGSAALNLCCVASGRFDGYIASGDHPWDVAAGVLLVEEAGGWVSAPNGTCFDVWKAELVAACSEALLKQIVGRLRVDRKNS
jgi:myo-inositol-1(or 4)-monophosphatase